MERGPLRKIIREYVDAFGRVVEVLECGHEQPQKHDIFGPTNAHRRRCKGCLRGVEPTCRS